MKLWQGSRFSALSLLLWSSAEHPESFPVSRGCRYHSLSALPGNIEYTSSVKMSGSVLIYALFHPLPSLFPLNSDFGMVLCPHRLKYINVFFCYAVLMTFFPTENKNLCCLRASVTSGISLLKDILCLVIQKFL